MFWNRTNPFAGNSLCLSSPAQRPNEETTYELPGCLVLNEQPFLAGLRPAGGTDRISSGNRRNISLFAKAFGLIPHKLSVSTYQCFLGSRLDPSTLQSLTDRSKTSVSMMRSRQMILIQDSLCFLNWNSRLNEILIIKWTFNFYKTQPQ